MSRYEDLIHSIARQVVRKHAPLPSVQGYIPKGSVDIHNWTCSLRYPNPVLGMDPQQITDPSGKSGSFLEVHGISVPRSESGLISAISALTQNQDCGVTIGFKNSDVGKPHIIAILNLANDVQQKTSVKKRSNPTVDQGKTATPYTISLSPLRSPPAPTPSNVSTPAPSAVATTQAAAANMKQSVGIHK